MVVDLTFWGKLSARERMMAGAFGFLLAGMALWFLIGWLAGKDRELQERERAAGAALVEAKAWIAQEDLWKERGTWLDGKLQRAAGPNEVSPQFLEWLQKTAQSGGVSIIRQSLEEPSSAGRLSAVSVKLTVKGPLKSLAVWLGGMQQPGQFVEASYFQLKPEGDKGEMECSLILKKWYIKGNPFAREGT